MKRWLAALGIVLGTAPLAHADSATEELARADRVFVQACGPGFSCAPVSDANRAQWTEAAERYEAVIAQKPDVLTLGAATTRAALARKQLGAWDKATADYELLVAALNEAHLSVLERGDPRAKTPPDPKAYALAVRFLLTAHQQIGAASRATFDFARAARAYEAIALGPRFAPAERLDAAESAISLFGGLGDRERALRSYRAASQLEPTPDVRVRLDFLIAERDPTERSLVAFHAANRANPAAAAYAVEAIWKVAKLRRANHDDTGARAAFAQTLSAWSFMLLRGPVRNGRPDATAPPWADYAAEAELTLLDDELRDTFDYETNHHRWATVDVDAILGMSGGWTQRGFEWLPNANPGLSDKATRAADQLDGRLQHIVGTYPSLQYVPAAIARQGTLHDSLLEAWRACACTSKARILGGSMTQAFLRTLTAAQRAEAEAALVEQFLDKRTRAIATLEELAIRRYAKAAALGAAYTSATPMVRHARWRLTYFTETVADAAMRTYVGKGYVSGMFAQPPSIGAAPTTLTSIAPPPIPSP